MATLKITIMPKKYYYSVAADDYFIYNPKFAELKSWAKNSHCKKIPFEQNIPIRDERYSIDRET